VPKSEIVSPFDAQPSTVAVVGAGIVGLAIARVAAERGHRTMLFERSSAACGASTRNFGMVWPIGQPSGLPRELALRSREIWLQLAQAAGVWVRACGSIHLAHRSDEWAVLEEFYSRSNKLGVECELLDAEATLQRSPAANPNGLVGGLYSPTELCVNPRTASAAIAAWLARQFDARLAFNTTVVEVEPGSLRTSDGQSHRADRIVVCGGADLQTLFPERLANAPLHRCKLQMFKTVPQKENWRLGPHLASGLTLRHYQNFALCDTLAALKRRVAEETPELDRYGIHTMAAQNDAGEIILGDSHEYDEQIEPFDKSQIDKLIERELRRQITLPDWTIAERWHGVYAKRPDQPFHVDRPHDGVYLLTGLGGAGMTMSLGVAERLWDQWT
jgi:FAD dependent oxidoreductase TIGR03364